MDDYISRKAAIERFCNVYCGCSPKECGFKIPQDGAEECAAVRALKEVPAADVVEVVWCKDCKYYKDGKLLGPTKFCYYYQIGTGLNTADNDFCSKGERRVDNG